MGIDVLILCNWQRFAENVEDLLTADFKNSAEYAKSAILLIPRIRQAPFETQLVRLFFRGLESLSLSLSPDVILCG